MATTFSQQNRPVTGGAAANAETADGSALSVRAGRDHARNVNNQIGRSAPRNLITQVWQPLLTQSNGLTVRQAWWANYVRSGFTAGQWKLCARKTAAGTNTTARLYSDFRPYLTGVSEYAQNGTVTISGTAWDWYEGTLTLVPAWWSGLSHFTLELATGNVGVQLRSLSLWLTPRADG